MYLSVTSTSIMHALVSLHKEQANNYRLATLLQAVGEPPLFLAASVLFAIKDAITAARKESGVSGYYRMDSPATCERIRMACVDQFTEQAGCHMIEMLNTVVGIYHLRYTTVNH